MSESHLPRLGPGPWRVAFMGTPDFALPSLAALADRHDLVGVFTQPDRKAGRGRRLQVSPVKAFAQERGIPVHQPRTFRDAPEALDGLLALEAQVLVVAAYGLLLPPAVLEAAPGGALNVHASLLPRWRGASPVAQAILAGDAETGVSIMRMDAGLDTGPVLSRRAIPLPAEATTGSLTERLAELGAELLLETLPDWMQGRLEPEPQDEALATYAPRLHKSDGRLDWREPAGSLAGRVRAMSPWPGAFTDWSGQHLKIHAAEPVASTEIDADHSMASSAAEPGLVLESPDGPLVATGEGWLRLLRIQAPGGRPMDAADFARGREGFLGHRLGRLPEAEPA